MTNAIGEICKDIVISQINNNEVTIDVKELSPGFYFIKFLTCNNLTMSVKLIKSYL